MSQISKDVCVFLTWAAEPEMDDRKRMGMKAIIILSLVTSLLWYSKRHRFTAVKTRGHSYTAV